MASAALGGWVGWSKLTDFLPCVTPKIEINDSLEILKKFERRRKEKPLLIVNFETHRKT